MANICIKMCESMYQIPTRVICIMFVVLQGAILDYYLIKHKNIYWYSWVIADLALVFVFTMAFIISYRHLILAKESAIKNLHVQTGGLPLSYFAWFVYSTLLAIRVAIIFKDFAWQLDEKDFFGPNTLKINIALAAIIFLLLLMSHNNASPRLELERKHFITELTGTVVFDVLDSVDVLDILFDLKAIEDFPAHMDTAIIVIACLNFILPTIPLMTLSRTHFGHKSAPKDIMMMHKMLLVFLVNLPLLNIRLLLWHLLSREISVFPMKNVIVIFLVFHDLYEKKREKLEREEASLNEGTGEALELAPQS